MVFLCNGKYYIILQYSFQHLRNSQKTEFYIYMILLLTFLAYVGNLQEVVNSGKSSG